jgi:transcriptional regulator with XRE-family HTH domain
MTMRDLASKVGVDAKTVERWVQQDRTPHPRHRWKAAEALGVDETVLWPESIRTAVKTGHDREIVAVYPDRATVPKSLWRKLITEARESLTFAGYTNYFLWLELNKLGVVLRSKLEHGTRVRFLLGDPDSPVTRAREEIEAATFTVSTRIKITLGELEKLRGSGLEARFSDRHIAMSVFQFDHDLLVCVHLADQMGHASPTLHIRRHQPDGLHDRLTGHVDSLWTLGRDMWPS